MVFFFNDPATTEIYTYGHTFSLHDALPSSWKAPRRSARTNRPSARLARGRADPPAHPRRSYQAAAAPRRGPAPASCRAADYAPARAPMRRGSPARSEEPTSELQSLMRHSYAVSGLTKTNNAVNTHTSTDRT